MGSARKCFLKKDNIWMMAKDEALKLDKLGYTGDTTDVPGEDVKVRVSGEPYG